MQQKKLLEYAALETRFRALEAERETMREEIVTMLHRAKIDKLETEVGSFTVGRRVSWTYTEAVKKIEERLKIARTKEQQKGLAESSETEYLLFKEPKLS